MDRQFRITLVLKITGSVYSMENAPSPNVRENQLMSVILSNTNRDINYSSRI